MKSKKGKAQKKGKSSVVALVIFIVIAAIVAVWFITGPFRQTESETDNKITGEVNNESDGMADSNGDGVPDGLEQYMTINLFPGFSGEEAEKVIEGRLSNSDILMEYAGSYDGVFYEDGENQEKEQIFSLILTNIAEDTLEVMQLWLEDENGESYQFQVSALPTGGTVLAQELSGKQFREDGEYRIVRDNFGFLGSYGALSVLKTDEADGKLYLTNDSEEPLQGVQIIYKNWLGGHAYPGGIAYRISLDEIGAGETLEISPGHYRAGESRITGMKQVIRPEGGTDGESAD